MAQTQMAYTALVTVEVSGATLRQSATSVVVALVRSGETRPAAP